MTVPPIEELELAAKKVVWKAREENSLPSFTKRTIRETVEKQFLLDLGTLGASEYRDAIGLAIQTAIEQDPPNLKAEKSSKSPANKKSNGKASEEENDEDLKVTPKNARKGKGKRVVQDSDYSEDEQSPKKKPKATPKSKSTRKQIKAGSENEEHDDLENKPKGKAKLLPKGKSKKIVSEDEDDEDGEEESQNKSPTSKKQKQKGSKAFKSLEHVPTSDMESDEPMQDQVAGPSTSKAVSKSSITPKPESANTPKKKAAPKSRSSKPTTAEDSVPDTKSDSELSVLIDEPPKKKRKSASEKKPAKSQVKKSSKSSATLSKDEETIKRLKSLVVACGTRKVWSKVFQDLDTPQLQIKKLKEILADLGMTGRLSMEQAKTIKEKRELAQELEDVTEFAKKVTSRPTVTRRDAAKKSSVGVADESESEKESDKNADTDEEVAAPRKRMTARKSIMAFLEDQSDEE